MNSQYPISQITFKAVVKFTNQANNKINAFPVQLPYYTHSRQVLLNSALQDAFNQDYIPANCQMFFADYSNCVNVFLGTFPFHQQIKIKYESLKNDTVEIHFREIQQPSEMVDQEEQNKKQDKKNKKVRERSIEEALELVKKWRQMYDKIDHSGRRIYTLEESAKNIGISKKTLDDYYSHIQIATQYKFNFQKYKQMKIGILRKFVKATKEEGDNIIYSHMCQYILDNDTDKYWIDF